MPTIKEYFQNIATAIKIKNSEIVTVTPAQMPQAILDIPSGGGGDFSFLEPISYDSNAGYVSGTSFYAYSNQNYFNDVYLLEVGHYYIITLGKTIGNRFRAVTLAIDPTLPSVSGQQVRGDLSRADSSSPTRVTVNKFQCGSDYIYLAITKSTTGVSGIKTYVIDCTDWS